MSALVQSPKRYSNIVYIKFCTLCIKEKNQRSQPNMTFVFNFLLKPRNDLIKIVRAKEKRAREDMLVSNVKRKKIVEYEKDDKVSVRSMEPDKLVGDVRQIPAIIIGKTGTIWRHFLWTINFLWCIGDQVQSVWFRIILRRHWYTWWGQKQKIYLTSRNKIVQ